MASTSGDAIKNAPASLEAVRGSGQNSDQMSLAGRDISDLAPLLQDLSRTHGLRSLDLSRNRLGGLPSGFAKAVPDLVALDLSGNPIRGAAAILGELQQMRSLQELRIDLPPKAEDELVYSLTSLRRFNGLSLDTDEDGPPADGLTSGASEGKEAPAGSDGGAAVGVGQKSQLQEGETGQSQAKQVAGEDEEEEDDEEGLPPIREVALTEADLEQAAVLFGSIKSLRVAAAAEEAARTEGEAAARRATERLDDDLTGLFDRNLESVMVGLKRGLEGEGDPFVRQCAIIEAKQRLVDVCAEQAAEHSGELPVATARQFASVSRKLHQVRGALSGDMAQTVRDMRPHWAAKVRRERKRALKAEGETQKLLEAAQYLEKQLDETSGKLAEAERLFAEERSEAAEENRRLRAELARAQEQLRHLEAARPRIGGGGVGTGAGSALHAAAISGRGAGTGAGAASVASEPSGAGAAPQRSSAHGGSGAGAGAAGAGGAPPPGDATPLPPLPADMGGARGSGAAVRGSGGPSAGSSPGHGHQQGGLSGSGGGQAPMSTRMLSLKQLRDSIEAIYQSKSKYDEKCAQEGLPRETMEQHMYTWLEMRYGLKSLIVSHASALIRAVTKHNKQDNDVAVFGRIVQNEVDEEFRFVQRQLKDMVADLLRVYLAAKYPMKGGKAIQAMLEKRMCGVVYEEEWADILQYVYAPEQREAVARQVRTAIQEDPSATDALQQQEKMRLEAGTKASGRPRAPKPSEVRQRQARVKAAVAKGAINYSALLQIMLGVQLKRRRRFLARFVQAFRTHDDDCNGIVSRDQFAALIGTLNPAKAADGVTVQRMLEQADPAENDHVTFSDAVRVLLAAPAASGGQGAGPAATGAGGSAGGQ